MILGPVTQFDNANTIMSKINTIIYEVTFNFLVFDGFDDLQRLSLEEYIFFTNVTLHEKCACSEYSWSTTWTAYGDFTDKIQSEWGKMPTRKPPNANTFYVMSYSANFCTKTENRIKKQSFILFRNCIIFCRNSSFQQKKYQFQ